MVGPGVATPDMGPRGVATLEVDLVWIATRSVLSVDVRFERGMDCYDIRHRFHMKVGKGI